MRTILQLIEKLETTPKRADRNRLVSDFYQTNAKFRDYLDMIFGENGPPQIMKLPKFKADLNTPNGMHYSNLERQNVAIRNIVYDPKAGKNRERQLVRVLENIAPQEIDLIKAILQTKWKYCTIKFYQEELLQGKTVYPMNGARA